MGARDITGTMLRVCFGPVRKDTTLSKLLSWTLDEMATVQRDLDMCGDVDDAHYYAGMVDAFEIVAHWIAPLKEGKRVEFLDLIDKFAIDVSDIPAVPAA